MSDLKVVFLFLARFGPSGNGYRENLDLHRFVDLELLSLSLDGMCEA